MRIIRSYVWGWFVPSLALGLVLAAPLCVSGQGNPDPSSFKFNAGQDVQPVFEGWARNPDGSFSMYFGYLNRNYVETPVVAVGPDNKIEPGAVDRGQPTFFNPRLSRMAFSVMVPKDWGKKELVWSLTVRGTTEKAIAWLQPEWEIDPIYFGKTRTPAMLKNKAPVLALNVPAAVTLPNSLTLEAAVQDDGLPVIKTGPPAQAVGQETPPTLKPAPDQAEVPVNVPTIRSGRGGAQDPKGLVVNWILWRGPAAVTFEQTKIAVKDGKASTTAIFTQPGTYLLRARADDGSLHDEKDVTVTVTGRSRP